MVKAPKFEVGTLVHVSGSNWLHVVAHVDVNRPRFRGERSYRRYFLHPPHPGGRLKWVTEKSLRAA